MFLRMSASVLQLIAAIGHNLYKIGTLKGHSHEKVFDIIPLNHRLGPN
jgi:hypothetical protein